MVVERILISDKVFLVLEGSLQLRLGLPPLSIRVRSVDVSPRKALPSRLAMKGHRWYVSIVNLGQEDVRFVDWGCPRTTVKGFRISDFTSSLETLGRQVDGGTSLLDVFNSLARFRCVVWSPPRPREKSLCPVVDLRTRQKEVQTGP